MTLSYGDLEELDGKTVASFEGSIANERLDFLSENPGFSLEYVYGEPHNYTKLKADFILGYSDHVDAQRLNNVLDVGVYYYLNSTFENSEMIFYDVVVTEGDFFLELEEKHLAENVEMSHRGCGNGCTSYVAERSRV